MATETIVAVFDTAAHAELAIADLKSAGIPTGAIEHFAEDGRSGELASIDTQTRPHSGFWSWLTGEEGGEATSSQHTIYDRSMASGHTVVTVVVDSLRADEVIALLDRHAPLDVDQHGGTYVGATEQGAGIGSAATAETAPVAPFSNERMTAEPVIGDAPARQAAGSAASSEQVIPLSEETLQVGKKAVDRGVTRVRRFVVERPVEEQIRLRDERVSVFRRPVSGSAPGSAGADAFSEKIVEVTETDEEAVIGKTAHVVEEVVVQKSVDERVETVRDTLRHEEVDIEGPTTGTPQTARQL